MLLFNCSPYLTVRVTRPPGCVFHLKTARLAENFMPNVEGRTKREASVAGCGLDEDAFEWHFAENLSVSYTIEGHSPCEAESLGTSACMVPRLSEVDRESPPNGTAWWQRCPCAFAQAGPQGGAPGRAAPRDIWKTDIRVQAFSQHLSSSFPHRGDDG